MSLRPLRNHRLSWEQRKALHERLVVRAAALREEVHGEELREIGEAMRRLDTAAYGACIDCGAPIAWDRLLAHPQVRRCMRCLGTP